MAARLNARTYDRDATSAEILRRMHEGEWLNAICRSDGMPSAGTFLQWVAEDPGLAERYARARSVLMDVTAHGMILLADEQNVGEKTVSKQWGEEVTKGDMIEHRRLQIETRKWLLARLAPHKYGERTHIEQNVTMTITDRMKRAEEKAGGS